MKIIHTADVHLSKDYPERLDALEEIVEMCEDEKADLLLISGDLFDRNTGPDDFETDIRPLFSDNSFHTLVIPGNHDESAFREESYFGSDIEQLTDTPFESRKYQDLRITGVPYTEEGFAELVEPLSEEVDDDRVDLLMIHCTLTGVQGGFGEESEYLPVKPEELVKTGFDYVFSGHIHSRATRKDLGGTVFTYPGSPVSISSSETGKRHVWILDTETESLETRELDTFHHIERTIELMPNENERIEDTVRELETKDLEKASVTVELHGFTDRKIGEIQDDLKKMLEDLDPGEFAVENRGLESMASIVDSDIYVEFKEKMDERDPSKPDKVEKKFLRALSRYDRG